jgi:hypothetical protein
MGMRKFRIALIGVLLAAMLCSCATVYKRAYSVNSASLTDSLTISGDSFTLQRTSQDGTAEFQGKFEDHGDQWVFNIESWKPANAAIKRFNPAVRYIYQVKKFGDAVSFMRLVDVVGTSTFQFIQPGDYQLR